MCCNPRGGKRSASQFRKVRKSKQRTVTAVNSLIESQNGDSDGAEKNMSDAGNKNFPDVSRGENSANVSVTSPLVGEVDAAQQRRERGMQRDERSRSTPLPDPPPQGGREQQGRAGKQPRLNNQPRRHKRDVHGWVVLHQPIGPTST